MTDRTPIQVPRAPANWRMNPDQMARVAQDPRLHRLSNDELYILFNPPKKAGGGNVFADYAQKAMRFLGMPDDWLSQAFSWHPSNTMGRTSNVLTDVNERRRR